MTSNQRIAFSSFLTALLSTGHVVFSRDEAQQALGISTGAFLDAAERQQRKQHLLSPRRGFYVIVPPQYLAWGAPPPPWYIDELMRHEAAAYYVGLLKAAELHGATHQAVMEFQVVTGKRLPTIRAGRSPISFYYRRNMAAVTPGIEDRKTDTGRMKISSVELTALDLLRYPHAAGGIDNIATIIADVGNRIDAGKLADLAGAYERSVIQRLGFLLDRFGHADRAGKLYRILPTGSGLPWIELERSRSSDADLLAEPTERNDRWHVIVRRSPERDE